MMATDNNEDFRFLSAQAMELGKDSIPIFLAILSREIPPERKLSVIELSKNGVCLARLNDLAKEGIYSIYEIPILLRHMEQEPFDLHASLIPAETLRLITGLDVGYSEQFVAGFTKADEPKRKKMLSAWRNWYEEKIASEG
ncbi:hypothetical protein AAFN88_16835 [Pelagibius sp. CAU 1746]|uniref:hypothetical protein n=1 Tax=Pelagibius sp. CAU 1746 TaxID=3140370 RepID=UPI00325A91D9